MDGVSNEMHRRTAITRVGCLNRAEMVWKYEDNGGGIVGKEDNEI